MSDAARKVAILGTVMTTRRHAPYEDPSWEIFCTGGDTAKTTKRFDRWYEIHNINVITDETNSEYQEWHKKHVEFLKGIGKKCYVLSPSDHLPEATVFQANDIVGTFSPEFLDGAPHWMLAHVIFEELHEKKKKDLSHLHVRLFGIDFASDDERKKQWAGIQHFILLAEAFGANIEVPEGSALIRTKTPYPFNEESELAVNTKQHLKTLQAQLSRFKNIRDDAADRVQYFKGRIEEAERILRIFCE